jgi:hypothetical protein
VLELRARSRTGTAIRALLSLAPTTARVVRDNEERDVALDQVHSGEILRVRPGDKIPDGFAPAPKDECVPYREQPRRRLRVLLVAVYKRRVGRRRKR